MAGIVLKKLDILFLIEFEVPIINKYKYFFPKDDKSLNTHNEHEFLYPRNFLPQDGKRTIPWHWSRGGRGVQPLEPRSKSSGLCLSSFFF